MKHITKKDIFNYKNWKVAIKGDDALEDLFGQDIVYFMTYQNITLNNYVIFWYNKKLYLLNNSEIKYLSHVSIAKMKSIFPNITYRVLFNGEYIEEKILNEGDVLLYHTKDMSKNWNRKLTIIYIPKTLKDAKFKINPIKERVLFLWLKYKFWRNK